MLLNLIYCLQYCESVFSSDWFQSETSVTIVLYTHCTSMKPEYVIVDRNDNDLQIYTFIKPKMFKMHISKYNFN